MKFCLGAGCPNRMPVNAGPYCASCRPAREQAQRGPSAERGYNARWHAARTAFLREFPLCGMRPGGRAPVMSQCYAEHRATPASVVDHVRPQRGDEGLFWDREGNWQALCRVCHGAKTRAGL